MKLMHLAAALGLAIIAIPSFAQEKKKKKTTISIGSDMVKITKSDSAGVDMTKEDKTFAIEIGMVDVGINGLRDQTNYTSPEALAFLHVPADRQNENLFSLKNSKSINVNVYPILAKLRLVKTDRQKIYLSTGIGLQMYNFRFNKNISYINNVAPAVVMDTLLFTKNKLGFTYLSIPLMATFKTKLVDKAWLVYGVGITGGYRIASWTKQISGELGKVKNHDKFNFNDFNSCITAEIGLDNYFRLYASYQLTPLHENAMVQNPYCIGLRFGGM